MSTLREYLTNERGLIDQAKKEDLAKKVGSHPGWIWQIATGWKGRKCSPRFARDIERATNGKVKASSLEGVQ